MNTIRSRRALLAGAPVAAAAALVAGTTVNGLAAGLATPSSADPIFGLIEKHTAACDVARGINNILSELPSNDREYEAVDAQLSFAFRREREAATAVLICPPTTIAGIVAVLEHVGRTNWVYGDDDDETILIGAYESRVNAVEARMFPKHLADALRNLIARGEA